MDAETFSASDPSAPMTINVEQSERTRFTSPSLIKLRILLRKKCVRDDNSTRRKMKNSAYSFGG